VCGARASWPGPRSTGCDEQTELPAGGRSPHGGPLLRDEHFSTPGSRVARTRQERHGGRGVSKRGGNQLHRPMGLDLARLDDRTHAGMRSSSSTEKESTRREGSNRRQDPPGQAGWEATSARDLDLPSSADPLSRTHRQPARSGRDAWLSIPPHRGPRPVIKKRRKPAASAAAVTESDASPGKIPTDPCAKA
jgi:hypothetical protein